MTKQHVLATIVISALLPIAVIAQERPLRRVEEPEPSAGWTETQRTAAENDIRRQICEFERQFAMFVAEGIA